MKKVMSLILAAMMVLSAVVALAAPVAPSPTIEDLTAPVDLTKEAQDAHDAFAPGLPVVDKGPEGGNVSVGPCDDVEGAIAQLSEETIAAINEVLGSENAVANEAVVLKLEKAIETPVKITVPTVYEEGTKLAIALIVGENQYVFEGTADAKGYVTFTIPAEVAEEIVTNNGATVVIYNVA